MDVFELVRTNQVDELESVLKSAELNVKDARGATPLILACYYNHGEAVKLLLDAKADPDLQDLMGNTALMGACFKGYLSIAALLLNSGASVDKQNDNSATALTFAATFGRSEMVELLLNSGADPLLTDRFGKNPVDHAKVQGNDLCYELLAEAANRCMKNNLTNI